MDQGADPDTITRRGQPVRRSRSHWTFTMVDQPFTYWISSRARTKPRALCSASWRAFFQVSRSHAVRNESPSSFGM